MTFRPYEPPAHDGDPRPAVISWFRVYAAVTTLLALAGLGAGVLMARASADPAVASQADGHAAELGVLFILLSTSAAAVFYGVATFVPFKPWGWSIGVIAIGLGLTSCMVLVAVPLLVYWLKPTTRAAFGRL